jgi:hypothetical protein
MELDAQNLRRCRQRAFGSAKAILLGREENCNAHYGGDYLSRKLEAFAKNFVGAEARNSSNFASGPRQIRHEADFDRIEGDEKDQRNLSRGPLCYQAQG